MFFIYVCVCIHAHTDPVGDILLICVQFTLFTLKVSSAYGLLFTLQDECIQEVTDLPERLKVTSKLLMIVH